MKSYLSLFMLAGSLLAPASAQLTVDQKVNDFLYLTGLYAKNYAPYEWKRDAMGFDLYNIRPWLDRVKASKDDLEFYDICVRYVASLQDSHSAFTLHSDFKAGLPFDVDVYDGKVLIEEIYRFNLPASKYPFNIGDELVSIDGKPIMELVESLVPYSAGHSGNPSARRRFAAQATTYREQEFFPHAPEVGESATIVVRSPDGSQASYVVPWSKQGTAVRIAGLVPSPNPDGKSAPQSLRRRFLDKPHPLDNAWGAWSRDPLPARPQTLPPYLEALRRLQTRSVLSGRALPSFVPPAGFTLRVGSRETDAFLSGTFPIGQKTAGFLRFWDMGSLDSRSGPSQLAAEIAFLQKNTDALVIDLMHNPGGSACYAENVAQYLIPWPFRGDASRLRATHEWLVFFSRQRTSAIASNAAPAVINLYNGFVTEIQRALSENRGTTRPLPVCTPDFEAVHPATDKNGNMLAYTKPLLVLVDEFSRSAAELLAMFLQDEGRATIFGVRTSGAGGAPGFHPGGAYGGGSTGITSSMVTRKRPVSTPGFPTVDHIENVGIYPDIVVDYMTRDNLLTDGRRFVEAFTAAVNALMVAK